MGEPFVAERTYEVQAQTGRAGHSLAAGPVLEWTQEQRVSRLHAAWGKVATEAERPFPEVGAMVTAVSLAKPQLLGRGAVRIRRSAVLPEQTLQFEIFEPGQQVQVQVWVGGRRHDGVVWHKIRYWDGRHAVRVKVTFLERAPGSGIGARTGGTRTRSVSCAEHLDSAAAPPKVEEGEAATDVYLTQEGVNPAGSQAGHDPGGSLVAGVPFQGGPLGDVEGPVRVGVGDNNVPAVLPDGVLPVARLGPGGRDGGGRRSVAALQAGLGHGQRSRVRWSTWWTVLCGSLTRRTVGLFR
jgi:hypothetical protein